MTSEPDNPYILTEDRAMDAPVKFTERLRYLGPGLILTASIVGSGELIATTLFGARAGFVCFWLILVSCLVKVALQIEFGKYALYTGHSTMMALNRLPGPRLGRAGWAIWVWLGVMLAKLLQVGGIIGGVAVLLNLAFPAVPVAAFLPFLVIGTAALVSRGYGTIERASMILTVTFTVLTLLSVIALQWTPYAISGSELLSGMNFHLPKEVLFTAIAAFSLTGIGGDEILVYNYWLLEKGYAARTGPRKDTAEWAARAHGWIRIMHLDALLSMCVYTVVTAAFYLLGAAVLHRTGNIPEDKDLLASLSAMYTTALGPWAKWAYLAGGMAVLASTLLAATGAWGRQFADAAGQFGFIDFLDTRQRNRAILLFTWLFPTLWALVFLLVGNSTLMVLIGGVATMAVLLVVAFASVWFRRTQLPASLKPGRFYDLMFTLSVIAILAVGGHALSNAVQKASEPSAPKSR